MTDSMHTRRSRTAFAGILVDAAFVSGAGLITGGVAMIYRPAGLIVAGLLLLIGAVLLARKGV